MTHASRLIAVLLAALACAAAAPAPETPPDPEGQVVTELVVHAPDGGPAWWKVTSGASTVWVLGVPDALPKGLKWDDVVLDRRLGKASRVILPSTAHIGILDLFSAFSLGGKLQTKTPFEASLPPDVASRFAAAATALHQTPAHYDRLKPAFAALVMLNDYRKQAALDANQPVDAVKAAAGRHHLPAAPAISYPAMPMLKGLVGELTDAVNLACLTDALQEIEAEPARVRSAAQAWAVGDVAGALTAERGFERCLAALPNGADLVRRTEGDQANAMAAALKTPGSVVAVVELRPLLASGGVLDQLRARGYAVRPPGAE